jgi:hypothetical protein
MLRYRQRTTPTDGKIKKKYRRLPTLNMQGRAQSVAQRHIDIHAVEKSPNSTQFEYKKHRETRLVVCLCVSWAFGDALYCNK